MTKQQRAGSAAFCCLDHCQQNYTLIHIYWMVHMFFLATRQLTGSWRESWIREFWWRGRHLIPRCFDSSPFPSRSCHSRSDTSSRAAKAKASVRQILLDTQFSLLLNMILKSMVSRSHLPYYLVYWMEGGSLHKLRQRFKQQMFSLPFFSNGCLKKSEIWTVNGKQIPPPSFNFDIVTFFPISAQLILQYRFEKILLLPCCRKKYHSRKK